MFNTIKVKRPIVISLLTVLMVLLVFSSIAVSQEDPFSEIKGKMAGITEKERDTIQKLFVHVQKIEEMEMEEKRISTHINKLKTEISELQKSITGDEIAYEKKKETLRQVLTSYQRMGPGSYMEILFEAEDMSELFMRINILRELTHNTGELLEEIQMSKDKQSEEKTRLSEKLVIVEMEQHQLVQTLAKSKQFKADMENYLASLAEERGHYQEYLDNLQKVWDEIRPFFSEVVNEFSAIVEKGGLQEDALKISYSLFSIKVSLDEENLNKIIKENSKLSEIIFEFQPDKVEMRVPEKNLVLEGKFNITDGYGLKFDVEKGSFYGLPLEVGVIKGLFKENSLILNFKSQLEGFKMDTLEIKDGYLNISIKLL